MKPILSFNIRATGKPYPYCDPCNKAKASAFYYAKHEANKAKQRAYNKTYGGARPQNLRVYGLSVAQFDAILAAQGGVCAICGRPETCKRRRHLAVDHDHKTGAIRGLLCDRCNLSLGGFSDSLDTLRAAVAYMEKHAAS